MFPQKWFPFPQNWFPLHFSLGWTSSRSFKLVSIFLVCLDSPDDTCLIKGVLGLLGDIYRSSNETSFSLNEDLHGAVISCILALLKDQSVPRELKPSCFGTLSDIISLVRTQIQPYLQPILAVLGEAGEACLQVQVQVQEDPSPKYREELTKSVLDTFSSLIQTLSSEPGFQKLFSGVHLTKLLEFIQLCSSTIFRDSENILSTVCGLIGDIFQFFTDSDTDLDRPGIYDLLEKGLRSTSSKVRRIARWAKAQNNPGLILNLTNNLRRVRFESLLYKPWLKM